MLHCVFCLFYPKYCDAGCKIRLFLNPKTLDKVVGLLSGVYCISKT